MALRVPCRSKCASRQRPPWRRRTRRSPHSRDPRGASRPGGVRFYDSASRVCAAAHGRARRGRTSAAAAARRGLAGAAGSALGVDRWRVDLAPRAVGLACRSLGRAAAWSAVLAMGIRPRSERDPLFCTRCLARYARVSRGGASRSRASGCAVHRGGRRRRNGRHDRADLERQAEVGITAGGLGRFAAM